jgi:type I restriction enzyme M protein
LEKGKNIKILKVFVKVQQTEEIEKNGFRFNSRKICWFCEEDEGVPFEEKIETLKSEFKDQVNESNRLNELIQSNLGKLN